MLEVDVDKVHKKCNMIYVCVTFHVFQVQTLIHNDSQAFWGYSNSSI